MKCVVCGKEYDLQKEEKCPVCKFLDIGGVLAPEMDSETKKKYDATVIKYREDALKDISVYAIGYIMQEKDGKIVLDSREEILIAEDIFKLDLNKIYWSPIEYGKETPGQTMSVDVAVKSPSGNQPHALQAKGPDTKGFWKLGFILKPGFEFAVAVGDTEVYSESTPASLK